MSMEMSSQTINTPKRIRFSNQIAITNLKIRNSKDLRKNESFGSASTLNHGMCIKGFERWCYIYIGMGD